MTWKWLTIAALAGLAAGCATTSDRYGGYDYDRGEAYYEVDEVIYGGAPGYASGGLGFGFGHDPYWSYSGFSYHRNWPSYYVFAPYYDPFYFGPYGYRPSLFYSYSPYRPFGGWTYFSSVGSFYHPWYFGTHYHYGFFDRHDRYDHYFDRHRRLDPYRGWDDRGDRHGPRGPFTGGRNARDEVRRLTTQPIGRSPSKLTRPNRPTAADRGARGPAKPGSRPAARDAIGDRGLRPSRAVPDGDRRSAAARPLSGNRDVSPAVSRSAVPIATREPIRRPAVRTVRPAVSPNAVPVATRGHAPRSTRGYAPARPVVAESRALGSRTNSYRNVAPRRVEPVVTRPPASRSAVPVRAQPRSAAAPARGLSAPSMPRYRPSSARAPRAGPRSGAGGGAHGRSASGSDSRSGDGHPRGSRRR